MACKFTIGVNTTIAFFLSVALILLMLAHSTLTPFYFVEGSTGTVKWEQKMSLVAGSCVVLSGNASTIPSNVVCKSNWVRYDQATASSGWVNEVTKPEVARVYRWTGSLSKVAASMCFLGLSTALLIVMYSLKDRFSWILLGCLFVFTLVAGITVAIAISYVSDELPQAFLDDCLLDTTETAATCQAKYPYSKDFSGAAGVTDGAYVWGYETGMDMTASALGCIFLSLLLNMGFMAMGLLYEHKNEKGCCHAPAQP
jgi:hypothetical protein